MAIRFWVHAMLNLVTEYSLSDMYETRSRKVLFNDSSVHEMSNMFLITKKERVQKLFVLCLHDFLWVCFSSGYACQEDLIIDCCQISIVIILVFLVSCDIVLRNLGKNWSAMKSCLVVWFTRNFSVWLVIIDCTYWNCRRNCFLVLLEWASYFVEKFANPVGVKRVDLKAVLLNVSITLSTNRKVC